MIQFYFFETIWNLILIAFVSFLFLQTLPMRLTSESWEKTQAGAAIHGNPHFRVEPSLLGRSTAPDPPRNVFMRCSPNLLIGFLYLVSQYFGQAGGVCLNAVQTQVGSSAKLGKYFSKGQKLFKKSGEQPPTGKLWAKFPSVAHISFVCPLHCECGL